MTGDEAAMNEYCDHCGVRNNEHNYEHMARTCYPDQIARLRADVERLQAELELSGSVEVALEQEVERLSQLVEAEKYNSERLRAALRGLVVAADEFEAVSATAERPGRNNGLLQGLDVARRALGDKP